MHSYPKSKKTATLKLVQSRPEDLRLAGASPAEDMLAGRYLVKCEGAWIKSVGRKHQAVLQFRCVDGKHDGVGLRMWVPAADEGGIVAPAGRYANYCAIALGRPLREGDPFGDPAKIFSGKIFQVFCGYRKSEHRGGGGKTGDDLALTRKDPTDFFRALDILELTDI
jgi:hypothetical protein